MTNLFCKLKDSILKFDFQKNLVLIYLSSNHFRKINEILRIGSRQTTRGQSM